MPENISSTLLRQQFQLPPKKYRPIVRWWWPGNNVDEAELRREIDALDKAGIGGAEIQAFNKGFVPQDLTPAQWQAVRGYATPSFFRHVGVAAEAARNHGMFIDYTFGSGWPFGGGMAITPELASIELRYAHLSVAGPAKLHQKLQIPAVTDGELTSGNDRLQGLPDGWAARLKQRTKVVAVVAARGDAPQYEFYEPWGTVRRPGQLENGASVDLTAQLSSDGVLTWDVPPGTWQLFVFCSVPTVQRVNGAAGEGPQLVMDHLSTAAFEAHAKRVGDDAMPYIGQYFGNGMRAIFCDSLEVGANLFWSDDFLAEFRRRRGYDLIPYLPILKLQGHGEPYGKSEDIPIFEMEGIGEQVRFDYHQTVSDLMIERFYEQFNRWAHDHKLLSRTQAHGAPADVLRIYGESDISETEDLYDNGGYDFLKMAASSANVYGHAIVGSESFVWPNGLYETTPEKMKIAADELLTAGVNAIVYHGFGYRVPGMTPPGWHPFNGHGDGNYSSQLNEQNPFWPYLGPVNAYMTRVQYISQTGRTVSAVALYRNDLTHGAGEQPPVPRLNQALLDAGFDYDHINAESLMRCSADAGMLITTGGASYRALVLPSLHGIDAGLAEKLTEFASAGLAIFFSGQAPLRSVGFLNAVEGTMKVQAAMRSLRSVANVYFATGIPDTIAQLGKSVGPNVRFRGNALPFIQKRIGEINAYFICNPYDAAQRLDAEFEAAGIPELWDPWTGASASLADHKRNGDWIEVHHELQPFSSALIVFDPANRQSPAAAPAPAPVTMYSEAVGDGGWELAVTGLVPSGKTDTIRRKLSTLIDWSLDSDLRGFSGRGTYSTSFHIDPKRAGNDSKAPRYILDLGNVRDVAEVSINGKHAATLLLRPYQVDITGFVQSGQNTLEVIVTNTLYNCMALRDPRTFRIGPADNPSGLMSSGLLGPVQIRYEE